LLAKFATKIPDNPELLPHRQLTAAANEAGIDCVDGPDYTERRHRYAGRGDRDHRDTASSLNQISVQFNVKGSFFNLESWFAAIEKLPRAMKVTQWSLTPGASANRRVARAAPARRGRSRPRTRRNHDRHDDRPCLRSPQVSLAAVSPGRRPAQAK